MARTKARGNESPERFELVVETAPALLFASPSSECSGYPERKPMPGKRKGLKGLELPPVDSPQSAVKVGVAYQIKQARK